MSKHRLITVRWHDHHASDAAWAQATPPETLKPARVESKGWLISENAECVEISSHRPMDADETPLTWGSPMRIVKSAIFYRSDAPKKRKPATEPHEPQQK